MADQKKWFKVWASILMDNNFQNMRMEDKGRWLTLGALVCQQGEKGMIRFYPPALVVCQMFAVVSFDTLIVSLKYLEKCNVKTALHEDGSLIVIIKNWYKYQRDDSKDRVRKFRLRAKRNVTHQEERRGEVTPTSTSSTLRDAPPLGAGRATRETTTTEDQNGAIRSKSIDQQVAERQRALRSGKIRSVVADSTKDAGKILGRFGIVPKVPPKT